MDMNITAFIIERDASLWLEKKTEKIIGDSVKIKLTQCLMTVTLDDTFVTHNKSLDRIFISERFLLIWELYFHIKRSLKKWLKFNFQRDKSRFWPN